jgi:hypothetical protein
VALFHWARHIFEELGYGWDISISAFIGVILATAPIVFYTYGRRIRERWTVEL